jgi:uncharacterized protein
VGDPGMEYLTLQRTRTGFLGAGTVLQAPADFPLQVQYAVACDSEWRTRQVQISLQSGLTRRELRLRTDRRQRWWFRGRELSAFRGCLDVDLGISPFTNTLPIRRLALQVGQSREISVLWVRFPELVYQPLAQIYTRLSNRLYRYENADRSFRAELEVDDLGLVIHYEGGWERVTQVF